MIKLRLGLSVSIMEVMVGAIRQIVVLFGVFGSARRVIFDF